MTYELAKQLKDAGFPQGNDTYIDVDGIQWLFTTVLTTIDKAYAPTLSELIEACGDDFESIERDYHDKTWTAKSYKFLGFDTFYSGGEKTPEEAVAKLWLALNEKK